MGGGKIHGRVPRRADCGHSDRGERSGARPRAARQVRDPRRDPSRDVPGRSRSDDRGPGPAEDRHRAQGRRLLHVGCHDLPGHEHDHRADLREAVRPLRPATPAPDRYHVVPDRFGPVGPEPDDVAADPVPGPPGSRRGRAVPDRPGGHRRSLHARRAGQVPGPLRSGLRDRIPDRAGSRWVPHRQLQLALGVLRQPADRDRGPGCDRPPAAEHQGAPARHQDRLPRRDHAEPRAPADPGRPDPRRDVAMERPGRLGQHRGRNRLPRACS